MTIQAMIKEKTNRLAYFFVEGACFKLGRKLIFL